MKSQFNLGNVSTGDVVSVGSDLYKAATLSDEEVAHMANQVAQHYDKTSKIAPASSPYSKRLAKLVARYGEEDGLKLNYKVYMNPEINAFSLADGTVRVNSGLMDKMNDDELLFVIGHEIGHVKNGHSKTRMQRAYAASAATKAAASGLASGAGSSVGGVGVAIGGEILADLAAEVVKAQFSQGDETESDEYGLQFINKGGHPADASVQALIKLADNHGDEGGVAAALNQFTSSHPDPLARAEHLRELIPGLPAAGDVTVVAAQATEDSSSQVGQAESSQHQMVDAASEPAPAARRVPVSTPAKKAVAARGDGGWSIQVGAFSDKGRALQVMDALSQQSLSARIENVALQGGVLHRVLVGAYATREDARSGLSQLQQAAAVDRTAFVRMVSY